MKNVIFLLLVPFIVKSQVIQTVIFPTNRFVNCNPYPYVPVINVDTAQLEKVENYGAKGDGKTLDDAAIVKAIKGCRKGIIFSRDKTYLVSKTSLVDMSKSITVYAYGATIKMADFTRYTFLSFVYPKGSYQDTVLWLGGTLDGNRDKQSYPGSPSGRNEWAESHGRFLGAESAEFALFKDVSVVNVVMDGIGIDKCRFGVISDCKASNGAPFQWRNVGQQGTYFKITRVGFKIGYILNTECDGGSIGIQFSYPEDKLQDYTTIGVIVNCKVHNAAQNPVHVEDCVNFFVKGLDIYYDDNSSSQPSFHLSNRTIIASLKNVSMHNSHIDFNNASNLKIGIIDSCQFTSNGTLSFRWYSQHPLFVLNSKFDGAMKDFQTQSKYNMNDTFMNFGSAPAILDYNVVEECVFQNGSGTPVQHGVGGGAIIHDCTFINCTKPNKNQTVSNENYKNIFKSYIDVTDDKGNFLMRIDAGIKN